ncbi:LacI family DNA-binding transcriptional regulator [Tenacibaculum sp. M341]|uniref:LacI family DNA-binding transcriptional regulator n=1 Tax=Tenacibaculum sp. M341 TaxID=2530339 RepID=UPI001045AA8D|nr:LacI family DNA-binding transcriptional regulator [Tenacibaculum sp. M341]TCI94348.1 LacI family transcriptional regulator [Tenacibaculum sp. M341]
MKRQSPTLKKIASNLKLSVSTVSRALNDNKTISNSTKEKVKKEAERLNYVPNVLAKNFRNKKMNIIGVIVPNITHDFTTTILKGIFIESQELGYRTIVSETNDDPDKEQKILEEMTQFGVDGILLSLSRNTTDLSPILSTLQKKPLIIFDKASDKVPCTQIVIDEVAASFNAVEYLIKTGKKRIAIIKEVQNSFNSERRYQGYVKALKKYNLPIDENLILKIDGSCINDVRNVTFQLINFKNKPDAIFCITDAIAIGVIKALKEKSIAIPDDVSVVGFSNSGYSTVIEPSLTSVNQPGNQMGRVAIKQIIEEINNNDEFVISKSIQIKTKLIVRESTH